jgi:myo-inositol 2-dehydrogenase / D-chiro-inositol 1-dehydrogenase
MRADGALQSAAAIMTLTRVGVVGCGRIGRMHAELLHRRVPGVSVAAVQDAVPEAAGALAGELAVPAVDTIDDVLAFGVDAVAICSSTDTHVELITAAARAGVAIFCEKPISLDLAQVDAALATVHAAGVMLHVGFNRRFDPAHRSVRDAVAAGELGRLNVVRITSRDPAPPPIAYIERSGGLFLDMTIHDFDMARFVTGSEVVEVFARGDVRFDEAIGAAGDIDTAVVVLRHADGCVTVIDNSRQCAYGYDQRVEAFGTLGAAASDNPAGHSGVRLDASGVHRPPLPHFFLDRYIPSYLEQWRAFVVAVAERGPAPVSGADGRAPLVLGLAAQRSHAEGRPVQVDEIG